MLHIHEFVLPLSEFFKMCTNTILSTGYPDIRRLEIAWIGTQADGCTTTLTKWFPTSLSGFVPSPQTVQSYNSGWIPLMACRWNRVSAQNEIKLQFSLYFEFFSLQRMYISLWNGNLQLLVKANDNKFNYLKMFIFNYISIQFISLVWGKCERHKPLQKRRRLNAAWDPVSFPFKTIQDEE